MKTTTTIYYWKQVSPVGTLLLRGNGEVLSGLWILDQHHAPPIGEDWVETKKPFEAVIKQLEEYFAGKRTAFDLGSAFDRGTAFQREVWEGLCGIGYGETISYAELARRVGRPAAMRAVGAANGQNPISIIVPCHRVIGANGSLTGYGGGLAAKEWLLAHERKHMPAESLALE